MALKPAAYPIDQENNFFPYLSILSLKGRDNYQLSIINYPLMNVGILQDIDRRFMSQSLANRESN
ncbi:MAG: hypothetical protein F6K48_11185 [Okeania sp. SIO3H1]|nr:hypothetical protein [Okeania sp. SIO3H1]